MAERPVYNIKRSSLEYNGLDTAAAPVARYKIPDRKSTINMTYKELQVYWQRCRKKGKI